ncbi:MAG: hypothetical protein LBI99_10860, partial [Propionibacteriaceae bacterium]|nr:hypothetical protein [Propionibacteriaceae bacterium]
MKVRNPHAESGVEMRVPCLKMPRTKLSVATAILAVLATLTLTGCTGDNEIFNIPPTSGREPAEQTTVPAPETPALTADTKAPDEEADTEPVLDPTCRKVDKDNLRRATDLVKIYWGGKIAKSAMVDAGKGYFVVAVR